MDMDTTNEPVAWMLLTDEVCVELTEWFGVMRGWEDFLGDNEKIVELYAHPVKELTDEEIAIIRKEIWDDNKFISEIFNDFARAILRKAQEK
jgi:hypothetical protein